MVSRFGGMCLVWAWKVAGSSSIGERSLFEAQAMGGWLFVGEGTAADG